MSPVRSRRKSSADGYPGSLVRSSSSTPTSPRSVAESHGVGSPFRKNHSLPSAFSWAVLRNTFTDLSWRNVIHVAMKDLLTKRDFPVFGSANLETITDAFMIRTYPKQTSIVAGDQALGWRLIIVLNGEVVIRGRGQVLLLGRGSVFGEEYLYDADTPFTHTIDNESEDSCDLAVLSRDAVAALAAWGLGEELSKQQKVKLIRKVHIFRHLTDHHISLVADTLRTVRRKQGDVLVTEGEIGSQFFIIKSGEVLVTIGDKTVRTLGKSDYFGERGLLYQEPRSATVTVQSAEAEFLVIGKAVFMHIIKGKMMEYLEERIRLQETDMTLDDLKTLCIIGRGTFGIVQLVQHRTRGTCYALKCISRVEAVRNNQQEALRLEREILLENDHPFIVKVVRTFKDRNMLYFLTELVPGGELYQIIRDIGFLSKSQVQFYISSLIVALESLHERCIAYRDLKPENVLLDSQGFIKLIDFGSAKKLSGHTYSVVGTPHYMAPEVILRVGYGLSCDVWSLGVCLYELICSPLPFAPHAEDAATVFQEILSGKLTFPPHAQEDPTAISLMKGLLRRQLECRLGCSRGVGWRAVRKHDYFKDFSFELLLSRQLEPPVIPSQPSYMPPNSARGESRSRSLPSVTSTDDNAGSGGFLGMTALASAPSIEPLSPMPEPDEGPADLLRRASDDFQGRSRVSSNSSLASEKSGKSAASVRSSSSCSAFSDISGAAQPQAASAAAIAAAIDDDAWFKDF